MADQRELILSRLVAVCGAVEGVANAVRNRLDVTQLERPAVVLQDGSEHFQDAAQDGRGNDRSDLQRMQLMPAIAVHVRGADSVDGGGLLSLYRSRILSAILNDATLMSYTSGRIRYMGAAVAVPTAEGKEYRIDLSLVFSYVFRLTDLASLGRNNDSDQPQHNDASRRPKIDSASGQAAGNAEESVAA